MVTHGANRMRWVAVIRVENVRKSRRTYRKLLLFLCGRWSQHCFQWSLRLNKFNNISCYRFWLKPRLFLVVFRVVARIKQVCWLRFSLVTFRLFQRYSLSSWRFHPSFRARQTLLVTLLSKWVFRWIASSWIWQAAICTWFTSVWFGSWSIHSSSSQPYS